MGIPLASDSFCQRGAPSRHPRNWDSRGAPRGGASFPVQPLAPSLVLLCSLPLLPACQEIPLFPLHPPHHQPLPIPGAQSSDSLKDQARGPASWLPACFSSGTWRLCPLGGPATLPAPPRTLDAPSPGAALLSLPLWLPGCRGGPAGPKAVAFRVRPHPHVQLPGCCQVRDLGMPPGHTQAHLM